MIDEIDKWIKRYERERAARKEAERLLEGKALSLFEKNQQLEELSAKLAKTVERRNEELRYSNSKLREEEQRLASLAQTFPGVIFQWFERSNGERGFYYLSQRCEEIFGFTAEAAIKNWNAVQIHPDDVSSWRESIEHSLSDMSDWRFVGRLITPSGNIRWWQGDSKPQRISPHEVVFNGVMLDITQQKKSEAQIRRLSMVASKTINGVVITDESGRVLWINEAFERITGYSLKEMVGRKPGDLLQGPHTNENTVNNIGLKLKNKEPLTAELLNYHKDGSTYWLRLDINPLFDDKGELTNFIGIETDITAQKENETALKLASEHAREAAEEANRANQAKSRFLASMSHEIRTPLNGVLGYTQVLGMRNDLPSDAAEMISSIGRSGEHLLHLINDILDLSKIEAGKYSVHNSDLMLQELLRDLEEMFRPNASLKGLEFEVMTWNYDQDCPLANTFYFHSDERALRQVLLNLVGNAVKFTRQGKVSLKGGLDGGAIRFSVEDTGSGIPPEDHARIFESFEQSYSGSQKVEGTGLGLPICRKLVELMEGSIYLDSTPGLGSSFWFEIPYMVPTETHSEYVPAPQHQRYQYSGERIDVLVVDDDENSRRVTKELLLAAGFRVTTASSGKEGLEMLERNIPDLIASDLLMPHMDGFEMCNRIKCTPALQSIPVVAVSASVMQNKENEARLKPFAAFVAKPVKAEDLYQKVGDVLKIKWETREEAIKASTPEAALPDETLLPERHVLESLLLLAEEGDMLELQNQLQQRREEDEQSANFYARLEDLAAKFQSQALEDILNDSLAQLPQS
ncbi:PAS domain S-box protein [Cerasicoccus maritimus]|uniref:PAS domain S-box protein n=1 Tax=Cerasicoccus maritimus TaxID=490089 RepID=UPI002852498D|nr:PAS domain S-box protein [Cerasicoccus maritimus]